MPAVNPSDGFGIFGTPTTRIRRPTDGSHWCAPDHVFVKAKALVMSAARSDQDYSYNTDFKIWRKNQDFGHQNISMGRPSLVLTPIGVNTINRTTSQLDLIAIGKKTPKPTP